MNAVSTQVARELATVCARLTAEAESLRRDAREGDSETPFVGEDGDRGRSTAGGGHETRSLAHCFGALMAPGRE